MTEPITQKEKKEARENAQALLEALYAGDKTSVLMTILERNLKRGFTARQLGLTKHQLGLIARHA